MNFSKKSNFLRDVSRFKARYKKKHEIYILYSTSRYEALQEKKIGICAILRLILNILPFLIVATPLFHKERSLLNSSIIL